MRIIHADTDDLDNPLRGGQPVRTYEIASRLVAAHDVTVFTATYKDARRQVVRDGVRYERLGMTVPRWGLSSHLSFLARWPAAIRRTPHDLVVEEFTPPFGFCGGERHSSRPLVSIVQWFFFDQWTRRYHLPFESMMRKRAGTGRARNLIVQTDRMGDYFRALLPNARIDKVPCGIDARMLQGAVPHGDYALYLGRLDTAHKGLDDLMQAWSRLAQGGVRIPLWIVGTGRDEGALKTLVRLLALDELVRFKGRLEGDAKQEALRACRFVVMPSREETFGLAALEAMASRKTVIAYDIDHLNELLKPGWATTVARGDVAAFAAAVASHWRDVGFAVAQGDRAHDAARYYTWDALAARQGDVYADLIRTRSHA